MNIVDSSGWIEYVTDEVNASFFEPPIVDSETLLILTISLYEVFKRVLREFGEERALDTMGIMSLGTIIDLDRQIAIHTAQISNEFKLAMADSIILATARAHNATLWTQDEHFKDIEGVRYRERNLVNRKPHLYVKKQSSKLSRLSSFGAVGIEIMDGLGWMDEKRPIL